MKGTLSYKYCTEIFINFKLISWSHSMTNRNRILQDDQTRGEENFHSVDHATCPGQIYFVTRMLTRDLFAVANLVNVH